MDSCRQRSTILIVFLSSLNCLTFMDFNSSRIVRLSYIAFKCSLMISLVVIEILPEIFYRLLHGYRYRAYVGRRYIPLLSGLQTRFAHFRFRNIKGGLKI